MILDTMTTEEVLREIKSDSREVKARWRKFSTKFRKLILKRQSFPWLWETTIKTKKYNEWYISFYAESKKEVGIINATFNMIFKYKGQLLTGTVKGDEAFIFSGHFFDRYKERFFKIHKENRLITDKDIMKVFFIFNSNCCFCNKEKEDNIRGFCYDGILLGDWFGGEGGIVKTFISRQEMKINQFAEYFEIFKMWIIEDMFKARKGFELEKGLIKYIPDTYFKHEEWDKFLFERDNQRLIKAAEECQEIYIKNMDEYNRCLKMIDTTYLNMAEKKL
jgi:hypothetical protein